VLPFPFRRRCSYSSGEVVKASIMIYNAVEALESMLLEVP
jgi:hypothetical protein